MEKLILNHKIETITNHFIENINNDTRQKSISLLSGRSGTVLFFSVLFKETKDEKYKVELEKNLEVIFEELDKATHLGSTYCDGLAGWGWLIEYLKSEEIIQDEYDLILEDVDDLLANQIEQLITDKNFDLLHGLLGFGLYFLRRKNYAVSESILLSLSNLYIEEGNEIKFVRQDFLHSKDSMYDLGLPHGMIGVLYFLSKCYQANLQVGLCKKIITGVINFYLNNIQNLPESISFFATKYLVKDYKSGSNQEMTSRLAWCYGDLTVLYSLYRFANLLDLENEKLTILKMLLKTSARKDPLVTGVIDASYCHGTSGIAYFYLKLYKMTKLEKFQEIADFWLRETLEFGNKDGYGGYVFDVSSLREPVTAPSSGILEGVGGIGLTLLAFQNLESENTWDECLFMS